jgi:hypothetical protein
VLGGFFGLDHFLLRNPKTGILKMIVNCFTFGFWYMYDLFQIFTDSDQVQRFGLTIPLLGPSGIGAGIFHGDGFPRAPPTSPSPICTLEPCLPRMGTPGLSHFIAGDFNGGTAKFLMTFSRPFFMDSLWTLYTMFYVIANTPEPANKRY